MSLELLCRTEKLLCSKDRDLFEEKVDTSTDYFSFGLKRSLTE